MIHGLIERVHLMRKFIFLLLLIPVLCFADTIRSMINPQTGKNDIYQKTKTTPLQPTDNCITGDWSYDSDYIYVCTATNTWARSTISSWAISRTPLELTGIQLQLNGIDLQK
jgi:hypothetical protein